MKYLFCIFYNQLCTFNIWFWTRTEQNKKKAVIVMMWGQT